jgi:hypothetical protein
MKTTDQRVERFTIAEFADMQRKVDNKERGASRKEGVMSTSTRDR